MSWRRGVAVPEGTVAPPPPRPGPRPRVRPPSPPAHRLTAPHAPSQLAPPAPACAPCSCLASPRVRAHPLDLRAHLRSASPPHPAPLGAPDGPFEPSCPSSRARRPHLRRFQGMSKAAHPKRSPSVSLMTSPFVVVFTVCRHTCALGFDCEFTMNTLLRESSIIPGLCRRMTVALVCSVST